MGTSGHLGRRGADRFFAAVIVLILVWIGVYWLWEPDNQPRLSLASSPATGENAAGRRITAPGANGDAGDDAADTVGSSADSTSTADRTLAGARSQKQAQTPSADDSGDPSRVVPPEFREYTVREGDTFERIAQRLWDDRDKWTSIAQANPFVDPNRLRAGRVILVPVDPDNVQGRPAGEDPPEPPAPTVEYTVQRGDTLSEIAARFYGSTSFTDFLYLANRDRMDSKNDLRVGQTLVIPPKPSPDGGAEP